MDSDPTNGRFCTFCMLFGFVVPSGLLVLGGILGVIPDVHPILDRLSAYGLAVALLLFAGSYLLAFALRYTPTRG